MVDHAQSEGRERPFSGSILFSDAAVLSRPPVTEPPDCFHDLMLDRVVDDILSGHDADELRPYFHAPLATIDEVAYRQDVVRDVQTAPVRAALRRFTERMADVRTGLDQLGGLHDAWQQRFWHLHTCDAYLEAISGLASDTDGVPLGSDGMTGFRATLLAMVHSEAFASLVRDAESVHEGLDAVRYCTHIQGNKVTVTRLADEPDYAAEVEETFAKFQQGEVDDHLVSYKRYLELDHVEESVLGLVAGLFPDEFGALDAFRRDHGEFVDELARRIDREARFLLAVVDRLDALSAVAQPEGGRPEGGLAFCLPELTQEKTTTASGLFDLALATDAVPHGRRMVTNDLRLDGTERVIVVTGANHGGKTTYSRSFGQLHYLAALGLPVPARQARVFLCDRVFTHYEREEDVATQRGKLEDELVRMHGILAEATDASVIVINEIFASTSLGDAIELGTAVLRRIVERDMLCLCVTFIDELSRLGSSVVSMVAGVEADDPATRTFHVERRPADGLAHAVAVAEKYGLSRDRLAERIAS